MNKYSREEISKLNVNVEGKYDIFTDEDDVLFFAISKVEGPAENPVLYYAGAEHAIFVKNKLNMVVCDFIHREVREILADAEYVFISEFEGSTEITEYGGYKADVIHGSDEFDEIEQLIKKMYDSGANTKWEYRNSDDGKIIKKSTEDGTEKTWNPYEAERGLKQNDIDGFYSFYDCRDFIYNDGWIYFTRAYQHELLPDMHYYRDESVFCCNTTIYKMQLDGNGIEELYTLCDAENDFMKLRITEVEDGWVYFTEELADHYNLEFKVRTDGREKQLCSSLENECQRASEYSLLGARFEADGHYDDAAERYMTVLKIYQRLVDANPAEYEPKYAESCKSLLNCYVSPEQDDKAIALLERVLRVYENLTMIESKYEPNKAYFMALLSHNYALTGRYDDAEHIGGAAVSICEQRVENDPQTYSEIYDTALLNMANVLHDTKKYDKAEPVYKKLIELRERLADEQPDIYKLAVSINNLGSMYRSMGRYSDCEPLYSRALAMHQELAVANPASDEHKNELASQMYRVGLLYEQTSRPEKAKEMWEDAYETWSGMDDGSIGDYADNFVLLKEKLGKE